MSLVSGRHRLDTVSFYHQCTLKYPVHHAKMESLGINAFEVSCRFTITCYSLYKIVGIVRCINYVVNE